MQLPTVEVPRTHAQSPPHVAVRFVPQLSAAVTDPQALPSRVQNAGSLSDAQVPELPDIPDETPDDAPADAPDVPDAAPVDDPEDAPDDEPDDLPEDVPDAAPDDPETAPVDDPVAPDGPAEAPDAMPEEAPEVMPEVDPEETPDADPVNAPEDDPEPALGDEPEDDPAADPDPDIAPEKDPDEFPPSATRSFRSPKPRTASHPPSANPVALSPNTSITRTNEAPITRLLARQGRRHWPRPWVPHEAQSSSSRRPAARGAPSPHHPRAELHPRRTPRSTPWPGSSRR